MQQESPIKVVITGANGLLGWHTCSILHAQNCASKFKGLPNLYDIVALGHQEFQNIELLKAAVHDAELILHFAGVNRGNEHEVENGNPNIAAQLVSACKQTNSQAHILYANSVHSSLDTTYGNSKRRAAECLSDYQPSFTNLILPHIFGEGARPFYNNVTATLIHQIWNNEEPQINPEGRVQLLHAGEAARDALKLALQNRNSNSKNEIVLKGFDISVASLYDTLKIFHRDYLNNIFPNFLSKFDITLFNTYRSYSYPKFWPQQLALQEDTRGMLYEAVKGGGGGQCFLSTTEPGITRGEHFHINKIERFLVVQGDAIIRMRKVLSSTSYELKVSGEEPVAVDMPTLHTHSIENIGNTPLLTLFWTNEIFDPENPDTYADKVAL